jgi:hypothetical protein
MFKINLIQPKTFEVGRQMGLLHAKLPAIILQRWVHHDFENNLHAEGFDFVRMKFQQCGDEPNVFFLF